MSNAIAVQRREEVLQLIADGKRLSDIAPILGVSCNAISKALKDDPDYRAAISESFDKRLDLAEDAILNAAEQVDVSRARAYHDALKWRAGVEVDKFRDKQRLEVNHTGQVEQVLQFDASSLLDKLRTVDVQAQQSHIVDATHAEIDVSD